MQADFVVPRRVRAMAMAWHHCTFAELSSLAAGAASVVFQVAAAFPVFLDPGSAVPPWGQLAYGSGLGFAVLSVLIQLAKGLMCLARNSMELQARR